MANSNGVISAPVSMYDVKTVLGNISNDLATLCIDTHINPMARNKPFRYATVKVATEEQKRLAHFGLNPCVLKQGEAYLGNTAYAIISGDTTKPHWEYLKPQGGESSPYRLSDFNGYNHNADAMVSSFEYTATLINKSGGAAINVQEATTFRCVVYDNNIPDCIRVRDIINNSGYRLVAEFYPTQYPPTGAPAHMFVGDVYNGSDTAVYVMCNAASMLGSASSASYNVLLGFKKCNADGSGYVDGSGLFPVFKLRPWVGYLSIVNYFSRTIKVTSVGFAASGVFTFDGTYWNGRYVNGSSLWVAMTISLGASAMRFMYFYNTNTSPYPKFYIRFVTTYSGGGTYYTYPSNESRQSPSYIDIPTGDPSNTMNLYLTCEQMPSYQSGRYFSYNMQAKMGDTDWVNVTTINFHYT